MKHLLIILFVFFSVSQTYAQREIELCFEILNEQVKNDSRFQNMSDILPNWDLSDVLLSQWGYTDLSSYENFLANRVKNTAHTQSRAAKWHTEYEFLSRRTNIATVITSGNTITSQVVWFWRDSNFDFPVQSKTQPFWDRYSLNWSSFKEFVLYTHHNFNGEFLSCGLFRLVPLNWRGYGNVAETWYFTNVLTSNSAHSELWNEKCNSGFSLPYSNGITREWERYLPMKTNVCAIDYAEKDFVKQEILAVAYDNSSYRFNEYDVFQLQVQAMRNTDITSGSMFQVRQTFLNYLNTRTCFSYIHGSNKTNLPPHCNGNYWPWFLSTLPINNLFDKIFSWIFPETFAISLNYSDEELEGSTGLIIFDGLPFSIYTKIQQIPNKIFIDYLHIALTPNLDDLITNKKQQNIVLTPFEETFLQCWISYSERQQIIIDLIESYDSIENFDISDISYSNKKFWDCIIPFPDKEHRAMIIDWSFDTNQLLAMQLNWEYTPDILNPLLSTYIRSKNQYDLEYQESINALTQRYNEWLITWDELESLIKSERTLFDERLQEIEKQYANSFLSESISNTDTKHTDINFIIAFLILLAWLGLIFFAYKLRNK